MTWSEPLSSLEGVGPRRRALLEERGLTTLQDLLHLLPSRYVTPAPLARAGLPGVGERASVIGTVSARRRGRLRRGGRFLHVVIETDHGSVALRFYNQAWLFDRFERGLRVLASGRMSADGRTLTAEQYVLLADGDDVEEKLSVSRPLLPPVGGIAPGVMGALMSRALEAADGLEDPLPASLRERFDLAELPEAFRMVHRPRVPTDVARGGARVLFDRFVALLLPVRLRRPRDEVAPRVRTRVRTLERIRARFPFEFTRGQEDALQALLGDLEGPLPMRRLLQGDVGSGKTAVALAAALAVVAAGGQVLFLAPTEPLAWQHHDVVAAFLRGSRVRLGLLHARLPSAQARTTQAALRAGEIDILMATHAALAPRVVFQNLVLAIIDEQHRFGVRQRLAARAKGAVPHLLSMSATPIPRSLCLALHGDLDHAVIDELPPGRRPPSTQTVDEETALSRVREAASRGSRAFVVFPSIEAETMPALLREGRSYVRRGGALAGLPCCLLHGRMPVEEREDSLRRFRSGEASVMLATSMVEVGLDVPEATTMAIVGADRFGLATLHQMRGRVGRGSEAGTCYLVPSAGGGAQAGDRLAVLERESNGMRIAEEDLRMRGPGELAGVRQAGPAGIFRLDRKEDERLFEAANDVAGILVEQAAWRPGDGSYYDLLTRARRGLRGLPSDSG